MTFKYIRSMDSTSRTVCRFKTSATVCGSFDFGSACGVPLRPGDRLTVVPSMEVMYHSPSHARKRSRSLLSEPEEVGAKMKLQGERTVSWSAKGRKGCKGRRDRGRRHPGDRSSGHYSRIGARVGFPWSCRSPQGGEPRTRQEHLPGALSLLAPARQKTT